MATRVRHIEVSPGAAPAAQEPREPRACRWRRLVLSPAAMAYGAVIRARNRYYDDSRHVRRAVVPVVSVGNLTTGGTGKTPMVIWVASRLRERGRRPAVLTRGYRARPGHEADEVLELRHALPDVPVVVDADRVAGASRAVSAHGADCCLLDDGFQHRRLHRDLDIVLVDVLNPWGDGALLPAGHLREPPQALGRAGLVVLTRCNQAARARGDAVQAEIHAAAPAVRVLRANVQPARLFDLDRSEASPEELRHASVLSVCGLANPRTFETLLASSGARLVGSLRFADHHAYTQHDLDRIADAARTSNVSRVVTTRKDWVKLRPLALARRPRPPLVCLEMQTVLEDPVGLLVERLDALFQGCA